MKQFSIPILFLICLFISIKNIEAQTFVRLDDATGIPLTSEKLDSIQKACDSLIAALPNSIKSNFKIFDCGFYLQQISYQGGYPDEFLKMITKAQQQSQYYFLIGRGLTEGGTITFFVDLKFPDWSCLSNGEIDGLKANISILLSNGDPNYMIKNEVESLNMVSFFSKDLLNCCQDANRDFCALDNPDNLNFIISYNSNTPDTIIDDKKVLLITDQPAMPYFTYKLQYHDINCNILPCYGPLSMRVKIYYDRNCSVREKIDSLIITKNDIPVNTALPLTFGSIIQGGRVEVKIYSALLGLFKEFHFAIKGQNPSIKKVMKFVSNDPYKKIWFFKKLIIHESSNLSTVELKQFETPNKSLENLWAGWDYNSRCPRKGDPCGWGAVQRDNPSPESQELWDWKKNIDAGYNLLLTKVGEIASDLRVWCKDANKYNNGDHDDKVEKGADYPDGGINWTHSMSKLFTGHDDSDHNIKMQFGDFPTNKNQSFLDAMLIKYNNGEGNNNQNFCRIHHFYELVDDDDDEHTASIWKVFNTARRTGACVDYVNEVCPTDDTKY